MNKPDTNWEDWGEYDISVVLKDNTGAISSPYIFTLTVGGLYLLDTDGEKISAGLIVGEEETEEDGDRPVPTLVEITERGMVRIEWN